MKIDELELVVLCQLSTRGNCLAKVKFFLKESAIKCFWRADNVHDPKLLKKKPQKQKQKIKTYAARANKVALQPTKEQNFQNDDQYISKISVISGDR